MIAIAVYSAAMLVAAQAPSGASTLVPDMPVSRGSVAHEWPFSVDEGELSCVKIGEQRIVLFSEPWRTDVPQDLGNMTLPRNVVVSTNPMAILASFDDRELYLPFDSFETLIKRLAPFEKMALPLCDSVQPLGKKI